MIISNTVTMNICNTVVYSVQLSGKKTLKKAVFYNYLSLSIIQTIQPCMLMVNLLILIALVSKKVTHTSL